MSRAVVAAGLREIARQQSNISTELVGLASDIEGGTIPTERLKHLVSGMGHVITGTSKIMEALIDMMKAADTPADE